ncbi:hypothetical protein EKO04_004080 [Ascochyta lentis]|uniref:Uncharacterized protein n=1 Tax=Ascochyta lentis TaxID=205686 RepID=A0A8H7J493_9PLEO|nr:hypothetical protein EKO04_004080 [Ascochyta lentis]
MVIYHQRSPSPAPKPYGYGHPHNNIVGLQVIQYRSYQRDISVYHLHTHVLSFRLICTALQSQKEYLDKLTGFDPLHNLEVVEGDEISPGCIEAAYLPNVFHGHGSALAIRTKQEPGRVEWFIFSGPVDDTVLSQLVFTNGSWALQQNISLEDTRKIFDIVGYVEKGLATRTVKGANREHKGWHDSLCAAEERKKTLKLTWRGFGANLSAEHDKRRLKKMKESTDEQNGNWGGDTLIGDGKEKNAVSQRAGEADETNVGIRSRRLVGAKKTTHLRPNTANAMLPPQRP